MARGKSNPLIVVFAAAAILVGVWVGWPAAVALAAIGVLLAVRARARSPQVTRPQAPVSPARPRVDDDAEPERITEPSVCACGHAMTAHAAGRGRCQGRLERALGARLGENGRCDCQAFRRR